MTEGNKRYLGDVVINEENYKRQREFFNDIIQNWQGSRGGKFDAYGLWDRISGTVKLAEDFATAEEGLLARSALQSDNVIIGANKRKKLINSIDPQHIYTDGVLLDDSNTRLMSIDWLSNLNPNTLSDVLIAIDNKTIEIINMFDNKLDVSTYNNFMTNTFNPLKESLDEVFEEFTDEDGDVVTKLNSDLVNGIRFILITQDKYDALPDATKKYWRNFFIIKDPNDIPADYADPMMWELTDGYTFEVRDGYLCVNNGLSSEWKQICSLQTLLSGANLDTIIYNYITDPNNDFVIPANNIRQSVSLISPNDIDAQWRDYPFLSSNLHDDFIKTLTVNDSSNYVNSVVDINGFKKVDIDMESIIISQVSPQLEDINDEMEDIIQRIISTEKECTELRGDIDHNTDVIGDHTQEIGEIGSTSIGEQLSALDASIGALQRSINDLSDSIDGNKWQEYQVPRLQRTTSDGTVLKTVNYYNPKTKLAVLYFSFHHYHNKNDAGEWVSPKKSATKLYDNNGCFVKAIPFASVAAISFDRPNHVKVGIQPIGGDEQGGKIMINCDYTSNADFQVYGHIVYRYRRLK